MIFTFIERYWKWLISTIATTLSVAWILGNLFTNPALAAISCQGGPSSARAVTLAEINAEVVNCGGRGCTTYRGIPYAPVDSNCGTSRTTVKVFDIPNGVFGDTVAFY